MSSTPLSKLKTSRLKDPPPKLKPTAQKQIVTVGTTHDINSIIKSVRVYEKDGKCHLDYRVSSEHRLKGQDRYRFSTGKPSSKLVMIRVEREKFALALEHYLSTHELSDGNVYFKDIALKALEEDSGNRTADTHEDYLNIYHHYIAPTFDDMLLEDIKVADLKAWQRDLLQSKMMSKSRYMKYHRTLNFIFQYAYLNEHLNRNLMDLLPKHSKLFKKSSDNSSDKYYSADEVKQILASAEGWMKPYLSTLFYTGMRSGESLALKWSDCDFEKKTITIQRSIRQGVLRKTTKTGVDRIIDMPLPVKRALLELQEEAMSDEWIFPSPRTLQPFYQTKAITKTYFRPLLESLGIAFKSLYATRHSYASIMIEKNLPMTYVQKQLGHAKLSTTLDYYVKNGLMGNNQRDERVDQLFA